MNPSLPAINFDGVSKRYVIHHNRPQSFQELLVSTVRRTPGSVEDFWALRDVSFSIPHGETVGVLGHNGSGKSTILKMVAGLFRPTSGKVAVNGKVSALIELGAGFHPDLTGRENVFLFGSIMGIGGREMKQRFDGIVDFAELTQFIDEPVKHYSSGMYMRLGFATALSVDADILLIDEVLSVGDQHFQDKCLAAIEERQRRGMTIVMVSHELALVQRFCRRALLMDHGHLIADGPAHEIISRYLEGQGS